MVEQVRSWLKENQTLVLALLAQAVALCAGGAALLAYMVRLEQRVYTMETRGAEYTVDRMNKMFDRLTIIEKQNESHKARLDRITNEMLKEMQQRAK